MSSPTDTTNIDTIITIPPLGPEAWAKVTDYLARGGIVAVVPTPAGERIGFSHQSERRALAFALGGDTDARTMFGLCITTESGFDPETGATVRLFYAKDGELLIITFTRNDSRSIEIRRDAAAGKVDNFPDRAEQDKFIADRIENINAGNRFIAFQEKVEALQRATVTRTKNNTPENRETERVAMNEVLTVFNGTLTKLQLLQRDINEAISRSHA